MTRDSKSYIRPGQNGESDAILKTVPGHGRSIRGGVLPVRLPCTASAGATDRTAARALLLLRVQPFPRQREGIGDVRPAVRPAQIDGDEVSDAKVADGTATARERKQVPQAGPKLARYSTRPPVRALVTSPSSLSLSLALAPPLTLFFFFTPFKSRNE